MGYGARHQVNTNFKNTVINFKHFLGRKFSDPVVQLYKNFVPCEVVQLPDDNIAFKVYYLFIFLINLIVINSKNFLQLIFIFYFFFIIKLNLINFNLGFSLK